MMKLEEDAEHWERRGIREALCSSVLHDFHASLIKSIQLMVQGLANMNMKSDLEKAMV